MKNIIAIILLNLVLVACGSTQKASKAITTGNYQAAFDLAASKLRKDKTKTSSQKNVPILKEAFDKAKASDKSEIARLKNATDKSSLYTVYLKYTAMEIRQDEVKALLPLYFEGKEFIFDFEDYTSKISKARNKVSKYLYDESVRLLASQKKEDARLAHKNLEELYYDLDGNYKSDIGSLLQKAKKKASSFVLVSLKNNIANQLKDSTSLCEIANFTKINTSNFTNPWVIYHTKRDYATRYDYTVDFELNKLQFVPEKLNQQKVAQQKRVQDGWQYTYDAKGNVMKDKDGNDIKKAKYVDVQAEVMLYQQVKSATINGIMSIKNSKTGALISTHPLTGEAKLENVYAKYRGDQRAIEEKYYKALQNKEAKFPADEVFKKYALDNLKKQAMGILNQQKF